MNLQESIRRILRENMNVKFYLLRRYDYDELNNILQNSLQTQSRNLKHYKDKTFNYFNNAVVRSMTERIGEELTDGWVEDLPIPENEIYDFVESLFKDKIIKKYDDLVTNNMNLQESIRRILREEIDGSIYKLYKSLGGIGNRELTESLPPKIIRRLPFADNLLDRMKKASLRYYKDAASLDELVKLASYYVTHSILPWHDERGNDYDNDEYNKWSDFVSNNLEENYGDQIKEYVNKVLPKNSFDNDGYKYVFWKHSEIHGGTGFSEAYKTWGDLIVNKGWWFPLDWWEIKSDLDKMNEGTKIFLKPGDKHNNYGYYFSIKKIKT